MKHLVGPEGRLYSVTEVAARCGVARGTIFYWLKRGVLWPDSPMPTGTAYHLVGKGLSPTPLFTESELKVAILFAKRTAKTREKPHSLRTFFPSESSESPVDK